jgi:hypothetical protein
MRQVSSWMALLSGLLLSAGSLFAHSDPRGDTHPQVVAMNGVFHVIFRAYTSDFRNSNFYRVVYASDGKVVVPRHKVAEADVSRILARAPLHQTYQSTVWPRIEMMATGLNEKRAEPFRPNVLVLQDKIDGVIKNELLPMEPELMADFTDFWISKTHAAILWNSSDPNKPEELEHRLRLTWFRRGEFAAPSTKDLGDCATIYDFSVASNLVWAGGRLWVAWMRMNRAKGGPAVVEAVLSSYDPVKEKIETQPLAGPANWNSHMSLATVDGWLCAAWHCSVDGSYPGTAQIITAFEKLPEAGARQKP